MKNRYISMTNHYLRSELNKALTNLNLTQEGIAELMRISVRHCAYLLKGAAGFGVVSLCCLLAFLPEDYSQHILRDYRKMILTAEENEPLIHRNKH